MTRRRAQPSRSASPPATAEEGAAHVQKFMVALFDRKDGEAADWPLIARALFLSAFRIADKLPDDDDRRALLRHVHEVSYARLTGDGETERHEMRPAPSSSAVPKAPAPRPPG